MQLAEKDLIFDVGTGQLQFLKTIVQSLPTRVESNQHTFKFLKWATLSENPFLLSLQSSLCCNFSPVNKLEIK